MTAATEQLTHKEAAAFLGVHPQTLRNWERAGTGPPSKKKNFRGDRVYEVNALKKWKAEQGF